MQVPEEPHSIPDTEHLLSTGRETGGRPSQPGRPRKPHTPTMSSGVHSLDPKQQEKQLSPLYSTKEQVCPCHHR